jgi:hypothetical protein
LVKAQHITILFDTPIKATGSRSNTSAA